ncbi:MAG: hypothetical protein H7Z43_16040 [Clostridia bacterium]|nr:hypothetical protein [Deltaproteobacteria bacterium]
MTIDLPPHIASADLSVQSHLDKTPRVPLEVKGFAEKDSIDKARRRSARSPDGLPGLEDKPPVVSAAAWVAASSFIKATAAEVMSRIEKRVVAMAQSGKRAIVIFDLDSTLYNNGPRQVVIFREFAEAYSSHPVFGTQACKLANFRAENMSFSNDAMARSCGVDTTTETGEALLEAYVDFWRARFFNNTYVTNDTVYANAVAQVRRIFDATDSFPEAQRVHVIYLTGRHKAFTSDDPAQKPYEGGMEGGTRQAIVRDGLPLNPARVTLMMKDNFSEKDVDFKGRVKAQVNQLGEVVGAFDNEPGNVAIFVRDYPLAMHVLVYTIASEKPAQPCRHVFMFGGGQNELANWPAVSQ